MNIVTFLSDFGLYDGYVGSVKGMILNNNPRAQIIDITHEIKPFQVEQAAYILYSYYSYFPKGTVHLAVIDPGVGSMRKPIIVKTARYYFVGPDNGLFSFILQNEAFTAYRIKEEEIALKPSTTFHGRDIFGPAAALLSNQINPESFAVPFKTKPYQFSMDIREKNNIIEAKIISVDRFGNLISNFPKDIFELLHKKDIESIEISNKKINKISTTYSDVKEGELLALWGSSGVLEISINRGDAAKLLKPGPGKNEFKIFLKNKEKK